MKFLLTLKSCNCVNETFTALFFSFLGNLIDWHFLTCFWLCHWFKSSAIKNNNKRSEFRAKNVFGDNKYKTIRNVNRSFAYWSSSKRIFPQILLYALPFSRRRRQLRNVEISFFAKKKLLLFSFAWKLLGVVQHVSHHSLHWTKSVIGVDLRKMKQHKALVKCNVNSR